MKYRTAAFSATSLTTIEFSDLKEAYAARAELWKENSRVAVQFYNPRFPQDGWRDVPYYQEHHLA